MHTERKIIRHAEVEIKNIDLADPIEKVCKNIGRKMSFAKILAGKCPPANQSFSRVNKTTQYETSLFKPG